MIKNAERFTGRIAEYERYRLHYPPELITYLCQQCSLCVDQVVADIGAGTGMLAELFLENGTAVFAIEPNAEMRSASKRLADRYTRLTIVDATAESTTLNDASVDFVTAGRAFHWFDQEPAIAEFRRILRPHGWVVLAANGRRKDQTSHQEIDYERILNEEGVDHRDVHSRYRIHDQVASFFAGGMILQKQWPGEQALTLDRFLGHTQSLSAVPLPGHPKYEGMQQALRRHFDQFQRDGILRIATACYVTCGQFSTQ